MTDKKGLITSELMASKHSQVTYICLECHEKPSISQKPIQETKEAYRRCQACWDKRASKTSKPTRSET